MSSALSSARRACRHRRPVEAGEECTSLLLPDLIGEGRCKAIAAEPQLSSPRSDRKRQRRLLAAEMATRALIAIRRRMASADRRVGGNPIVIGAHGKCRSRAALTAPPSAPASDHRSAMCASVRPRSLTRRADRRSSRPRPHFNEKSRQSTAAVRRLLRTIGSVVDLFLEPHDPVNRSAIPVTQEGCGQRPP